MPPEEDDKIDDQKTEDQKTDDQVDDKKDDKSSKDMTEEERIQAIVDRQLRIMKENMDKLDAKAKAAEERAEKLEKEKRDAALKKLEEEGKHKEAFELQLEEERAARKKAEAKSIRLSRDNAISDALRGMPFRNDKASQSAFNELQAEMVQDEEGEWKHKSGKSIRDAVKDFQKDDDNSYLFKVKSNTGTGDNPKTPVDTGNKNKSILEMSEAEVLQLAREGKLPRRKR